MKITGRLLLKNVLIVTIFASTDFICENSILNVCALTTNKALNEAVEKERDSWQTKLDESQNKIKTLQTDLNNAFDENKKIQNEKAASEKTAKDNLAKITAEKENAIQELTNSKKTFDENSKKLNNAIDKLQSEKEKLENDVLKQKENLKVVQKEYEDKIKAEQEIAKKNLEEETKKLNAQITEKTNQLNKTIDTLKKVTQEYSNTKEASASEEVKILVEIEILKSRLTKQKTELKALVVMGKKQDEAKIAVINKLKIKINTLSKEFETFVENEKSAELKNLFCIEKLTQKVDALKEKVNLLTAMGKAQEKKLLTRIKILLKKQMETEDKYKAIIEAYQLEEQKNLNLIDTLKFDLNNAIRNNKVLLKMAKRMKEEKAKEDIADSLSEANQLLKIDILNSELRDSIQKNSMLLKNTQKINDLKNITQKSHSGLNEKVKNLTNKLNNSNKKLEQIKKLYNNPKVWIKEVNSLKARDIKKLFSKNKLKNHSREGKFLNNDQRKTWEKDITGIDFSKKNQTLGKYLSNQSVPNIKESRLPISERIYPGNNFANLNSGNVNNRIIPGMKNFAKRNQQTINNSPIEWKQLLNNEYDFNENYQQIDPQISTYNNQKIHPDSQGISSEQEVSFKRTPKNQRKKIDNKSIMEMLEKNTVTKTKDDELVDFAIESIVSAVQKMTDNNERQTNASMNLIGAGHELPEKMDAVVKVIKEQFNPEILNKALDKLSDKYIQKQNFVDESLRHMYGKEGNKITNW